RRRLVLQDRADALGRATLVPGPLADARLLRLRDLGVERGIDGGRVEEREAPLAGPAGEPEAHVLPQVLAYALETARPEAPVAGVAAREAGAGRGTERVVLRMRDPDAEKRQVRARLSQRAQLPRHDPVPAGPAQRIDLAVVHEVHADVAPL